MSGNDTEGSMVRGNNQKVWENTITDISVNKGDAGMKRNSEWNLSKWQ
jgi:hypothetical protein